MTDAVSAPAVAPAPTGEAPVAAPMSGQGATENSPPAPAQAPQAAGAERPRGPDGKFLPVTGQGGAEAADSRPETSSQAAARRRLALKVRGEEHALELDDEAAAALAHLYGTTPDRLDVALQKSVAGDRALKEAAQERQRAARLLEALKASPEDALAQLGIDVDELALRRLQAAAQREAMTPEERALAEREAALAARERELRSVEEQRQQQALQAEQEAAFQAAQQNVMAALQQEGLPRSHRTIRMVADVMIGAMDAGLDLTPQQVAAEVRAQLDGINEDYLGALPEDVLSQRLAPRLQSMPAERLVALLGPRLRDVLQHTVQQHRERAGVVAQRTAPEPSPSAGPAEIMTPSEALRRMRERR